jgi:hypothetical protein
MSVSNQGGVVGYDGKRFVANIGYILVHPFRSRNDTVLAGGLRGCGKSVQQKGEENEYYLIYSHG